LLLYIYFFIYWTGIRTHVSMIKQISQHHSPTAYQSSYAAIEYIHVFGAT
jgi:hypothetical protein